MGTRIKTFESTGIAPNGRLYAGDLNAIQDMYADRTNYSQQVDLSVLSVGETGLKLLRYGVGEGRVTGHLRIDGIFRGLGGLYAGSYTTAQRDAIASGFRPYGLIILNTTTNRYEWNQGTDASPSWQPISPPTGASTITGAMLTADSVDASKIVDGSVGFAELAGALKPSVSAAAGSEALRALGTGAGNAAAGNDARLADQRTPLDNSVTNAKIVAGAGIPYSKLTLANSITNGDVAAGAGIIYSKLNIAGSIVNADVNPAAAIAQSKLAPLVINDGHVGVAQLSPNRISGTAVVDADARLTNQRVPLDNSVTSAKVAAGQITTGHLNFDVATQTELDGVGGRVSALETWRASVFMVFPASAVVTTNSAGHATVTFSTPFPTLCTTVVAMGGDFNTGEYALNIEVGNMTRFGFEVEVTKWEIGNMRNVENTGVRVNYIACGY